MSILEPDDMAPGSKKENPMVPISRLARRVRDEGRTLGLAMQRFFAVPNPDPDAPHRAQIIFLLEEEGPSGSKPDPEFEAFLEGQRKAEREQRADQDREGLAQLREELKKKDGGIL